MTERRTLIDGLKPSQPAAPIVDAQREREFVHGAQSGPAIASVGSPGRRVALSTRMRGDFAAALKRASLERQLNGIEPSTLQDILEQAIEPWLKSNGYIE
jgi:hypothetical protein